jgi:cobalt/nickel transport system permease protein
VPLVRNVRNWLIAVLAIVGLTVVAASIWASADPDGLERVAEDLGFLDASQDPGYQILPDYTIPGIDGVVSTIAAGLIGVVVVFGLVWLIGRVLARRPQSDPQV